MKRSLIVVAVVLMLCSCAPITPSPKASKVIEADMSMVGGCQYLGECFSSHQKAVSRHNAVTKTMHKAREQAADMGATHIVWTKVDAGIFPEAVGKAYKCSRVAY